jgi:hypothetical protein
MNATLALVLQKFVVVFFDDILIYSATYQDHLKHLPAVLEILQKDQWHVKFIKCVFAQQSIAYLGHVMSIDGVSIDPSKIGSIRNWPQPMNHKESQGFLGLTGCYREFIRN